ncbi:hypothetical protein [Methylophaga sp. OBS4]|nr:hypothetical protein [Methylophaga sp. OBS4]MCX4186785.1 hypothetical protein [Methylophaga sp. OBS4]
MTTAFDFWLLVAAIAGGGVSLLAALILRGRYKRRDRGDRQ